MTTFIRRVIGALIFTSVMLGIFAAVTYTSGFHAAIIIFSLGIILAGLIMLGIYLFLN